MKAHLVSLLFLLLAIISSSGTKNSSDKVLSVFSQKEQCQATIPEHHIIQNGSSRTFVIKEQKQLNSLRGFIEKAAAEGAKEITVRITPGTYSFNEHHLSLSKKDFSGISLTICGEGAQLYGDSSYITKDSENNGSISRYSCYLDENGNELSAWGQFRQCDRLIELVDETTKECRLHFNGLRDNPAPKGMSIQITMSFKSSVYKVTKIQNGFIYFVAADLSKTKAKDGSATLSVNMDYTVRKLMPRFRLFNNEDLPGELFMAGERLYMPQTIDKIRCCKACRFLYIGDSSFKSIVIDGLQFKGNSESSQLLTFEDVKTEEGIWIKNCLFSNIHSDIVKAVNSNNVTFMNNTVVNSNRNGFICDNRSANATFVSNTFKYCGRGMNNSQCINCSGTDFLVRGNKFTDFGYGAIFLGLHYKMKKNMRISGIVEFNDLAMSEQYMDDSFNNGLMDSGAIYCNTNHDDTIIRYNYIHGYCGYWSNNGIYCDEGTMNTSIYGNIITGIRNGYSIYWRRVGYIEKEKGSQVAEGTNTGSFVAYNILEEKYLFSGRERDNSSIKGSNLLIVPEGKSVPTAKLSNLAVSDDDVICKCKTAKPNIQDIIDSNSYGSLFHLSVLEKLKIEYK